MPRSFTCPRCGRTSHHPDDVRERYCGACHDWTGEPDRRDSRLRLRLYVDGQLADETWLDVRDREQATIQSAITTLVYRAATDAADERGVPWLVEVHDPDEHAPAPYLRFGTDTRGMVAPLAVPPSWPHPN